MRKLERGREKAIIKERNVEISDKIAEIHFNVDLEYNTNISLII